MSNLAHIVVFTTNLGIDVVGTTSDGNRTRTSLPYSHLTGTLNGTPIEVDLDTGFDNQIIVSLGGAEPNIYESIVCNLQPKGHFFGWVSPPEQAQRVDLATARKLALQAQAA